MFTRFQLGVISCVILTAASAFGQTNGPIEIKTPPLQNSDTISIALDKHVPVPTEHANWAGTMMQLHVLDNSEVDVDAVIALQTVEQGLNGDTNIFSNPFGPRSENRQSEALTFNAFDISALSSGAPPTRVVPSSTYDRFVLDLHVKGSDPSGNSDVDLTAKLYNIWHIKHLNNGFSSSGWGISSSGSSFSSSGWGFSSSGWGFSSSGWGFTSSSNSVPIQLNASDYVWVPTAIQNQTDLMNMGFLPAGDPSFTGTNNPQPGTYHWLHIENTIPDFLAHSSAFYATGAMMYNIGIEHGDDRMVPEPTSVGLLCSGAAFLMVGLAFRRRRKRV